MFQRQILYKRVRGSFSHPLKNPRSRVSRDLLKVVYFFVPLFRTSMIDVLCFVLISLLHDPCYYSIQF